MIKNKNDIKVVIKVRFLNSRKKSSFKTTRVVFVSYLMEKKKENKDRMRMKRKKRTESE